MSRGICLSIICHPEESYKIFLELQNPEVIQNMTDSKVPENKQFISLSRIHFLY